MADPILLECGQNCNGRQAAAFAEEWDSPEMNIYDNYVEAVDAALCATPWVCSAPPVDCQ